MILDAEKCFNAVQWWSIALALSFVEFKCVVLGIHGDCYLHCTTSYSFASSWLQKYVFNTPIQFKDFVTIHLYDLHISTSEHFVTFWYTLYLQALFHFFPPLTIDQFLLPLISALWFCLNHMKWRPNQQQLLAWIRLGTSRNQRWQPFQMQNPALQLLYPQETSRWT